MPVDLFISLMDQIDFEDIDDDISIILTCLSDDIKSVVKSHGPAGWYDVRKILQKRNTNKQNPSTILECLHLLTSLARRSDESAKNFVIRVKYFVDAVKAIDEGFVDIWVKILFLNGLVTPLSVNKKQLAFLLEELEQFSLEQELKVGGVEDMYCHNAIAVDNNKCNDGNFTEFNGQIKYEAIKEDGEEDVPLSKVLNRVPKKSKQPKCDINFDTKKKYKKPYVKVYNTHANVNDINW